MKTAEEIHSYIAQCYGSCEFHQWSILFRHHLLTDGVDGLCKQAECYWLVDAIASYHAECMKDPMLRDFQLWTLKVSEGKGVLTCERDTDDVAFTQEIEYTDFPLDEIQLYVEPSGPNRWTILFPSEH